MSESGNKMHDTVDLRITNLEEEVKEIGDCQRQTNINITKLETMHAHTTETMSQMGEDIKRFVCSVQEIVDKNHETNMNNRLQMIETSQSKLDRDVYFKDMSDIKQEVRSIGTNVSNLTSNVDNIEKKMAGLETIVSKGTAKDHQLEVDAAKRDAYFIGAYKLIGLIGLIVAILGGLGKLFKLF